MKTPCFICAEWNRYSKIFTYHVQSWRPNEGSAYIFLEERELEFFTFDEITLRQIAAKVLQGKKAKILADAKMAANEVDETIQELLALEDFSTREKTAGSSSGQGGAPQDEIPF